MVTAVLEYIDARDDFPSTVTREWLAADSPEDAHRFDADTFGILVHSGDGDGAVIIGNRHEIIEYLNRALDRARRYRRDIDGEVAPDAVSDPLHTMLSGIERRRAITAQAGPEDDDDPRGWTDTIPAPGY
jgi:hypothetical protein